MATGGGGVLTSYVITCRDEGGALKEDGMESRWAGASRTGRGYAGSGRGGAGPVRGRGCSCYSAGARGGGRQWLGSPLDALFRERAPDRQLRPGAAV